MKRPTLESLTTPALLLDYDVMIKNIEAMATRARSHGVLLRPHIKTHKSVRIAALQRERDAQGLTAATVSEAEAMVAGGCEDILIAYPPVGAQRLERVLELARHANVTVAVDEPDILQLLDAECRRSGVHVNYLWEVECGTRRLGTEPGEQTASILASLVDRTQGARFAGLLAFAGHVYSAGSPKEIVQCAQDEGEAVRHTAEALARHGIEASTLSVGTTPTAHHLEHEGPVSEARPGNYVFYDATQVALGIASEADCALSVLATVVARPHPQRLILDAGSKALAAERMSPRTRGFGLIRDHPDCLVERLYEEHAIVTATDPTTTPVGQRVRLIPNHACTCVNLHDEMYLVRDGEILESWPVDAQGWEQRKRLGGIQFPSVWRRRGTTARTWR